MKHLTAKELNAIVSELDRANAQENPVKAVNAFVAKYADVSARIEFPLGELMNDRIAGYVWAWKMRGMIRTAPISNSDQFNAQGLEGKCAVETDFLTAFNVWRDLPQFRCNVFAKVGAK